MEPIKIQIEVNLGEATLDIIKTLAGAPGRISEVAKQEAPEPQPKKATEKKAKPAPAPVAEPAPAEPVMEDLPPDDAPDPAPAKPTPTEDDARQAVKNARSRGVTAKAIKDYMKESFNIATSVECPAERRQELIDGLNGLAA